MRTRNTWRRAVRASSAALFALSACTAGNVATEEPESSELGDELPPDVACQADLLVTGNLLAESEVPTPDEGCVPDGRWELVVSVDDPADCGDVELRSSYTYDVHTDAESGVIDVTYLGADLDEDVYLKVTFEGGACAGNFEHYGAGGAEVLILRPYVEDQHISGRGMFERRD